MKFDAMTTPTTWDGYRRIARECEASGWSGLLFTETSQTPWMGIAAAAEAAPTLEFCTGIAVAFAISPMTAAGIAWELAGNTGGRFRLGLGSQVKAHIERRYGMDYEPPGPRMRDYVLAVKACLAAFRGDADLSHDGPYYRLSLLPGQWRPVPHGFGDIRVDISAVGPYMTRVAGEVADGVHVHPLHSMHYLHERLRPAVAEGAARARRDPTEIDLIVPVFIVPGDTPEERATLLQRTRLQIAFYGSTRNYAFQFDDLGFDGMSARFNELMKAGDVAGMEAAVTDEMLDHFAIVGRWDDVADIVIERYRGVASRVVSYLTLDDVARHPDRAGRWAEVARAVTAA